MGAGLQAPPRANGLDPGSPPCDADSANLIQRLLVTLEDGDDVLDNNLKDLADVIAWAHRLQGRVSTLWETQHETNERVEDRLNDHSTRLRALEARVMWYAGAAAMIGAALGGMLGRLIP